MVHLHDLVALVLDLVGADDEREVVRFEEILRDIRTEGYPNTTLGGCPTRLGLGVAPQRLAEEALLAALQPFIESVGEALVPTQLSAVTWSMVEQVSVASFSPQTTVPPVQAPAPQFWPFTKLMVPLRSV